MERLEIISEPELIRTYCQPHHHVIVFGANASMQHDASAAFIGMILDKKAGGKITLVDAQAYPWTERTPAMEKRLETLLKTRGITGEKYAQMKAKAGGLGGAASHRKSIRTFNRTHGLHLAVPSIWLADASDTGLPEGKADVSINRAALAQMIEKNADTNPNLLIREHLRPLRIGGHALFLFKSENEADKIRSRMNLMQMAFREYRLKESHYPIGPQQFKANCTHAIVVEKMA
ncbi:hypothetical protein HY994_05475 [Candidatus Micrarchaeota archaeon]|nr:hypothetical protein [Candidatus Micrarchaeota archaeon]